MLNSTMDLYAAEMHKAVAEAKLLQESRKSVADIAAIAFLRGVAAAQGVDTRQLLSDASREIHEMHAHHYAHCKGGCPAQEIVERIEKALAS